MGRMTQLVTFGSVREVYSPQEPEMTSTRHPKVAVDGPERRIPNASGFEPPDSGLAGRAGQPDAVRELVLGKTRTDAQSFEPLPHFKGEKPWFLHHISVYT